MDFEQYFSKSKEIMFSIFYCMDAAHSAEKMFECEILKKTQTHGKLLHIYQLHLIGRK